jgi:hypothetical protein
VYVVDRTMSLETRYISLYGTSGGLSVKAQGGQLSQFFHHGDWPLSSIIRLRVLPLADIHGFDHNTMQVIAGENIMWASWIEQLFEGRDILGRKPLLILWMMKVAAQPGL